MSIQVKRRREATGFLVGYAGPAGEILVDTTLWTLRVQDGSTAGGHRLALYSDVPAASPTTVSGSFAISAAHNIYRVNTTSGTATATLPASPSDGDSYTIKDSYGHAATHNIGVIGTVDGATNPATLITDNYAWAILQWNATTSQWEQIG